MHVIDEVSPLARETFESLKETKAFLLLTIGGIDETTGQTLMSRQEYHPSSLRWNHSFADIFTMGEDGVDRFDYTKFHDVEPLDEPLEEAMATAPRLPDPPPSP